MGLSQKVTTQATYFRLGTQLQGVGFPGEVGGVVPPLQEWTGVTRATVIEAMDRICVEAEQTPAARFERDLVRLCSGGTSELQIESVASVFDLDPAETNRLRNYVRGGSTDLVLESVLQLLGLPVPSTMTAPSLLTEAAEPHRRPVRAAHTTN